MPMTLSERLGRLLGFEGKASKTAKLIAWTTSGQPVWTPRDLAALAREGFMSDSAETEMIETKAAGDSPVITSSGATGDDVANAFDDFMRAFESFKAENEQRIQKLEKQLPVDVL